MSAAFRSQNMTSLRASLARSGAAFQLSQKKEGAQGMVTMSLMLQIHKFSQEET
jgi:hypothetical protein